MRRRSGLHGTASIATGHAGTLASLFGAAAGEELPERVPVGFAR